VLRRGMWSILRLLVGGSPTVGSERRGWLGKRVLRCAIPRYRADVIARVGRVQEDAQRLEAALAQTSLAGREITTIELSRWDEVIFAISLEADEGQEAWQAGRGVFEQTGRWPVVVNSYPDGRSSANPYPGPYPMGGMSGLTDEEVRTIGSAAVTEIEGARRAAFGEMDLERRMTWLLNRTKARVGVSPTPGDVLAALPNPVPERVAERWFLDWELACGRLPEPVYRGYLDWFEDDGWLMFCPTLSGAEILAPFPFWAEEHVPGASTERLIFMVENWSRRYGAELMANWGTMLSFSVARPPQTLDEAFELAGDQLLIAPALQVSIRDHARALLEHDTWMLHCRP
jgi:Domain of unknown function (DUF4253)